MLCRVGHIITLIQANINKGKIINRATESLLLYNFQPLPCEQQKEGEVGTLYLTIDMMIKPIAQINDTHKLDGRPIQLVVEAVSGEVMNNSQAMLQLGLLRPEELGGLYEKYNCVGRTLYTVTCR